MSPGYLTVYYWEHLAEWIGWWMMDENYQEKPCFSVASAYSAVMCTWWNGAMGVVQAAYLHNVFFIVVVERNQEQFSCHNKVQGDQGWICNSIISWTLHNFLWEAMQEMGSNRIFSRKFGTSWEILERRITCKTVLYKGFSLQIWKGAWWNRNEIYEKEENKDHGNRIEYIYKMVYVCFSKSVSSQRDCQKLCWSKYLTQSGEMPEYYVKPPK